MEIDTWLAAAIADAERRGLPELRPLLETLAQATRALRASDLPQQEPVRRPTLADQAGRPTLSGSAEATGDSKPQ